MESQANTEASLFSSSSISCELHKNPLEFICLSQPCLEKGLFFCCSKCIESQHKDHLLKLLKVDSCNPVNIEPRSVRKTDAIACLSCVNELNGKILLIINMLSKSMMEKCQTTQKKFIKSFERVFKKLSCESEMGSNSTFHSFDYKIPKMEQGEPFFSKDNSQRSFEFKNANLFYREFSKKFEKLKKVFASVAEQSNQFCETIKEFIVIMDETYSRMDSDSTEESIKNSRSTINLKTESPSTNFEKKVELPIGHTDEIMDLNFISLPVGLNEKANCLVSCSKDRSIQFCDLGTKKTKHKIDNLPHHINQIAFCPDSNILAASLSNDIVKLWKYNENNELFSFKGDLKSHKDIVWGLQFMHNGTKLLSSSFDSSVCIWDFEKGGVELRKIHVKDGKVYGLVYMEDKHLIAVAGQNSIFCYDDRDLKKHKISFQNAHEGQITKLDYSQNYATNYLASCSKDNKVKVWDLSRKDPLNEFVHEDYVYGVKFLNPFPKIASASDDKTLKVWSLKENRLVQSFQDHSDYVKTCQWDEKNRILASAGKDRKIIMRYYE